MNSSPRIKPITLAVSACGLVAVVLWVTPGVGFWRDGSTGQHDGDDAAASGGAGEGDGSNRSTRVRERPPAPDRTQRQLRNLLAEHRGMKSSRAIDVEKLKAFRAGLDRMGTEELLAVLKELYDSDASEAQKMSLGSMIAGVLSGRDPRLALDTIIGCISEGPPGVLNSLGIIFNRWAQADPAAAAEWLDRQAADGAFASVDASKLEVAPRIYFESQLIRVQAAQDPAAASARFATMPAEAREGMLSDDWFANSDPEKVKAVASFLRENYEDSTSALAKASSRGIRQGDFADAGRFLDVLDPTPAERAAIVADAVKSRVTEPSELSTSPQEAREWILKQAPQDANHLTGTMLAQMIEWHEFSEMSRLALQYRDESGSDDVLVAFLKGAPVSSKDEILKLAGQITDLAAREEVVGRFGW